MAIWNCQVCCAPLENYLVLKKTPLMSSKILTHNPADFLCLPTDLFTKHCHIKRWCFGKNTANTPCTPDPHWDEAACLRWLASAWVKPGYSKHSRFWKGPNTLVLIQCIPCFLKYTKYTFPVFCFRFHLSLYS